MQPFIEPHSEADEYVPQATRHDKYSNEEKVPVETSPSVPSRAQLRPVRARDGQVFGSRVLRRRALQNLWNNNNNARINERLM